MNVKNQYRGRSEVPLDAQGRSDAHFAGRELAGTALAAIYTSPLCRARETAQIIASYTDVDQIEDLAGLTNLDYGAWQGLTAEQADARDPDQFFLYTHRPAEARCPEGESLKTAADRILAALRSLGHRHANETVCAVSHVAMIRLAVSRVLGIRDKGWRLTMPPGGIITFSATSRDICVDDGSDVLAELL